MADDDVTAVYRWFDGAGALLYVGMARNVIARAVEHSTQPWWRSVRSGTVEWYPTRPAARAAERRAIESEHPIHNRAGTPRAQAEGDGVIDGSKVRDLRADKGLSQAALAAAAGVSRQTVNKIEQGVSSNPLPTVVSALARALAVEPDELTKTEGSVSA